jgi:hypothetical protein
LDVNESAVEIQVDSLESYELAFSKSGPRSAEEERILMCKIGFSLIEHD